MGNNNNNHHKCIAKTLYIKLGNLLILYKWVGQSRYEFDLRRVRKKSSKHSSCLVPPFGYLEKRKKKETNPHEIESHSEVYKEGLEIQGAPESKTSRSTSTQPA